MQITSAVEVSTVWLDPSNANHILLEVLVCYCRNNFYDKI